MLAPLDDMWDPNTWTLGSEHEYRIYGDNHENMFALVDQEDYESLMVEGYLWNVNWKRNRGTGLLKPYMRRAVGVNGGGARLHTYTIYLHQAIMDLMGLKPPSRFHTMIDHRNSKSLDCRRFNLRWATPSQNAKNIHGTYPHELQDAW